MTTLEEVIRQVETVVFDTQYPPTKKELEVLHKILKTVYVHHRPCSAVQHPQGASEHRKSGVFRNTLSNYMRNVEKRQRVLSTALTCRS